MKMPVSPPKIGEVLDRLTEDRLKVVLGGRPLVAGKYLHWDNVRHREPPGGLTPEEWWVGIKCARDSASESMPLLDKGGRPFSLVYAAPVRQGLHEIDQSFGTTRPSSDVQGMVD